MTCEDFYKNDYERLKKAQRTLEAITEAMKNDVNPSEDLQPIVYYCSRIKKPGSMIRKLEDRGFPATLESALRNVYEAVDTAISVVESFLLQLTRDEDAYEVRNRSSVLDTMSDVKNTMSLLLAGIAAISLLVGGIGIMNIMLVSVSERTREIGIRKAVGAKRIHIISQFLCEACILSVLGGIIGLALSFGVVEIYKLLSSSAASMNRVVGFAAIAFCAVIGLLFGGYPAAKASRLQPIDALHTT